MLMSRIGLSGTDPVVQFWHMDPSLHLLWIEQSRHRVPSVASTERMRTALARVAPIAELVLAPIAASRLLWINYGSN